MHADIQRAGHRNEGRIETGVSYGPFTHLRRRSHLLPNGHLHFIHKQRQAKTRVCGLKLSVDHRTTNDGPGCRRDDGNQPGRRLEYCCPPTVPYVGRHIAPITDGRELLPTR